MGTKTAHDALTTFVISSRAADKMLLPPSMLTLLGSEGTWLDSSDVGEA